MKTVCEAARALVCTYDDPELAYRVCELAKNVYQVPHVVTQLTDPSMRDRFHALGVTTMNAALHRPSLLALLVTHAGALFTVFGSDDNKEVCEVVVANGQDVNKTLRELKLPCDIAGFGNPA